MIRGIKVTALLALVLVSLTAFFATRTHDERAFDAEAGTIFDKPTYDPGSIVVRASNASYFDGIAAFARGHGYTVNTRDEGLLAMSIDLPAGTHVVSAISEFTFVPGVLYAEPVYQLYKADSPSDPLFSRQTPYLSKVRAPQAWDIEKGRPDVIVAVLDTGVDVNHPDLAGRIWVNTDETGNNATDDDGNGCVDDLNGCAFVTDSLPGCQNVTNGFIRDDIGHGTFVAGIIAADGGYEGIVGIARNVTVMPVKVLDCSGTGTSLAVSQGIIYAAKNGAKVINISLGGQVDSALIREAVRVATDDYGVLIVAASGNTGKEGVAYPARYDRVLAVGAASIANPDKAASFSTIGPEVDVVAIGESIVGTVPKTSCAVFLPCIGGQPYATGNGTSFSAPQVSGLAALILSRRPGTPPGEVLKLIKATAVSVPDGTKPNWAGDGRIDMAAALAPQFRLGAPGTTRN
jgi:subtilisin family serine protease